MIGRLAATLLLWCLCAMAHAQAPVRVQVEGAVRNPGTFEVPDGSRLSVAVLAAMPTADAYPTGASLLRRDAIREQLRRKAALAHDLQQLAQAEDAALRATADALARQLDAMPVTGRIHTLIDPRRVEVEPAANLLLAEGDRVVYPRRPGTVRIVGAVAAPCDVPHVPLRDAAAYLDACPQLTADRDWLYAIQPDGAIQRLGIALWNRSPSQSLAPGAMLYVPLPARALRGLDVDFNGEFATFLATQTVPGPADGGVP